MDDVLYEVDGGIATVTLNRPERLNSMNAGMLDGVLEVLENAAGDETVRALIFTGSGRAFCAGADLAEPNILGSGGFESRLGVLRNFVRSAQILRDMPKPTIAAVNGAAAGAGFAWALAADLRYASTSAKFVSAYVNVGLSGDFGGTWTLPKIVGSARAREIYLTNRPILADEAERIGLVAKTVGDDELMSHVRSVAAQFLRFSPTALKHIKENLNEADTGLTFAEALDRDGRRHLMSGSHPDAREARQAFLEKRAPVFRR